MAEVKLLGHWHSPFSRRVEMALKLKGVEYEYIEEDLNNKSPLLLKYNPIHKTVPVLLHNGKPIAESLIILEYIDETWDGPAILPKDPYERANARFWGKFLDEKCWSAMRKACYSAGAEGKEELMELLQFLDNEIKGKKFFGGDNIGYVDIAANFAGYYYGIAAGVVGLKILTKDKFPNLCKWIDEYNNCSFVTENLPPKDKVVGQFKARLEEAAASK